MVKCPLGIFVLKVCSHLVLGVILAGVLEMNLDAASA
jgi:hypothetical protein